MDYHSQKVARCCAFYSRQHSRARLFSICCRLGQNYSSQEASREAAWKWAAWKSLGPLELAASPANRAGLNAEIVGPADRAAGTPRYVAPGAEAASLKGSGESVSTRSPRVSAGWRPSGWPGVGTGCGGGGAGTRALGTWPDSYPRGSTFQTCYPALCGRAWSGSEGAVGSRPGPAHSGTAIWGNRAESQFPLLVKPGEKRVSLLC